MISLGVLASGGGSNLGALLEAIAAGTLDAKIVVVASNVPSAGALERAKAAGIPHAVVAHKNFPTREAFDAALVDVMRAHGAEWVVLAGFMRIVTPVLLGAFPRRVLNVHPALLPAFPGLAAQGQALAHGVRIAGVTVHFVDSGTDTGPIIAQAAVPVRGDDTEATLAARILEAEHRLLPQVVQWIAEGRVEVEAPPGRRVRVKGRETSFFPNPPLQG